MLVLSNSTAPSTWRVSRDHTMVFVKLMSWGGEANLFQGAHRSTVICRIAALNVFKHVLVRHHPAGSLQLGVAALGADGRGRVQKDFDLGNADKGGATSRVDVV